MGAELVSAGQPDEKRPAILSQTIAQECYLVKGKTKFGRADRGEVEPEGDYDIMFSVSIPLFATIYGE
jgi:hypothetical protein